MNRRPNAETHYKQCKSGYFAEIDSSRHVDELKFKIFQLVFELVSLMEVRAPKSSFHHRQCVVEDDPASPCFTLLLASCHVLLQITLLAWRIVSLENNACRSLLLFLASCSDH
jgi:hypothetical protein